MTIGLNIDGCSHSKKTSLTTQNKIVLSRSSGCSDLKGLTWFRQSFLFSSSANEALLSECWEATILDKRPGESDEIFVIPVISGCRESPSTLLVGWGEGLVTFDFKSLTTANFSWNFFHEQAVYSKRFTWYQIAILFLLSQYVPCSPA